MFGQWPLHLIMRQAQSESNRDVITTLHPDPKFSTVAGSEVLLIGA
jgi:hypothetical protein